MVALLCDFSVSVNIGMVLDIGGIHKARQGLNIDLDVSSNVDISCTH